MLRVCSICVACHEDVPLQSERGRGVVSFPPNGLGEFCAQSFGSAGSNAVAKHRCQPSQK